MNSRSSQFKEAIKSRSRVIGFIIAALIGVTVVWAGTTVLYQPDNNFPQPQDPTARSLQKINSILKIWEQAGYPVGATFTGSVTTTPFPGTNWVYDYVGAAWVKSPLTPTNYVWLLQDTSTNFSIVAKTNGTPWAFDPSTGAGLVTSTASTNQVSFSVNTTNLCASIGGDFISPSAGVVIWSCTNTLFGQNGGSGLINSFWLSTLTNQEFRLHIYNQEFAPPSLNAALTLTQVQRQWEIPGSPIASTNTDWGDWVLTENTNYVKTVRNLGLPVQNTAGAKTVLLIAEALGTGKSNRVSTATYAKLGAILDKP